MTVSVVIPSYNGEKKVPFLLDSLMSQTLVPQEVIVVIDGSTDNTHEVVSRYANKLSGLQIIRQKNSGRSKTRNYGASRAQGEVVIFYDDDVVPEANSVQKHLSMQQSGKRVVCGVAFEEHDSQKSDIHNYKASLSEKWTAVYRDDVTLLSRAQLFFTAANCSIKKDVFLKLGGFSDQLSDAEDYHFGRKAIEAGENVYFDKSNRAIHREVVTAVGYARRLRQYHDAHRKIDNLFQAFSRAKPKSRLVKRGIYSLFAFPFWIRAIDNEKMKWLPRAWRYRIYDLVLHAVSVEYPDVKL